MSVSPEYYYNLSGNITDGKKEYSLHHKENKIGGLSISSGLKENYVEYGTDSLLDLINKLNDENKKLREQIICENIYFGYLNVLYDWNKKVEKENKELKQTIGVIYDLIDGYIAIADRYRKSIESLTIGDDLGYWNGVYQYMKKLRKRIGVL